MNYNVLNDAIKLIGDSTPLKSDCGTLCGAACCDAGSENAGVWILPGEELISHDWGIISDSTFPVAGTPVKMLMCQKMCIREARPFMCRIFPLTPFFSTKRQVWDVRMDRRAAPMCPLYGSGVKALNPVFTESVRQAVRLLASDPDWESILKVLANEEAVYRMEL